MWALLKRLLQQLIAGRTANPEDPVREELVVSGSGREKEESGMATLRRGARGEEAEALQQQLKALGYYDGPLDGDFGPGTEAAVKAFQQAQGMAVDGVAGPNTLAALGAAGTKPPAATAPPAVPEPAPAPPSPQPLPEAPARVFRNGSRGAEVRKIQEQLAGLGFYRGPLDGDFGPGTEAAVKAFQQAQGMAVDGVAGPNTLAALGAAGTKPPAATAPPAVPEPAPAPPSPQPLPEAPARVFRNGSRGAEVRKIQEQLAGLGFYRGPLDGDFGGGTLSAVKVFQRAKGLGADGEVGPNTWRALFQAEIPEPEILAKPLNERCLALTGTFESNKSHPEYFATLSGDFDGQGISFGVLQWNFGQNTLQKLLGELIAEHPVLMQDTFQDHYETLVEVLAGDKGGLMEFARSIQHPVKHYLHQPWRGMFKALGRSEACQALQVKYAGGLYREALELCKEYGLWSERAAALMFDIKVQNGSIQRRVKDDIIVEFGKLPGNLSREDREVERMRIVANLRAAASNPRWVEDVRERKLCCANGQGTVHGVPFRLAEQFGIGLDPF